MRMAVNSLALPIYKKNRFASLLCIFETTIRMLNVYSSYRPQRDRNYFLSATGFNTCYDVLV